MKEKLFYESRPLQCHAKLAHMIGLSHAIVFQQMKWLISGAPEERITTLENGQELAEYTQEWLIREHFPFLCERQFRRICEDLQSMGLLVIESYTSGGKTHNRYGICAAHEVLLTTERYNDFLELSLGYNVDSARKDFREKIKLDFQNEGGQFVQALPSMTADSLSKKTGDNIAVLEDTNTEKKEEPAVEEFINEWKKYQQLPSFVKVTPKRRHGLKARLRDTFFRDNWKAALAFMASSPFHLGVNDRKWTADVDYFLRPDTVMKLIENRNRNQQKSFTPPAQKPRLPDNMNPNLFR